MPITHDNIKSQEPRWGINYHRGFAGFTYRAGAPISNGIAYFTRWDNASGLCVSHALVITGPDECIEAQPGGVVRSSLRKYFDDPKCAFFVRKPVCYNAIMAEDIVAGAEAQLGEKYGYSLILAHAIGGSLLGKTLSAVTAGRSYDLLIRLLDSEKESICSEVLAEALKNSPYLRYLGCLRKRSAGLSPQRIFEDRELWVT